MKYIFDFRGYNTCLSRYLWDAKTLILAATYGPARFKSDDNCEAYRIALRNMYARLYNHDPGDNYYFLE